MTETRVSVAGAQPYDVVIGSHLLGALPGLLGPRVRKVLVIHPGALTASAEAVRDDLVAQGYQAFLAEVPEVRARLAIAGAPDVSQSMFIAPLVDWEQRSRSQQDITTGISR
ncbi:MAG TPA: 3-dehydroquinate synthase, partial [Actinotalea sp.]|nr:3-dehydroquinate synthase [Actinotalea sp.]